MRLRRLRRAERGQAAVELVGAAALLTIAGLAAFQLLSAGHAVAVADGAAEAAALAVAKGTTPSAPPAPRRRDGPGAPYGCSAKAAWSVSPWRRALRSGSCAGVCA